MYVHNEAGFLTAKLIGNGKEENRKPKLLSGEAHRPFGPWVVCTCCFIADFLSFVENQLFVGIGLFLGQICIQINLHIDSAGGLRSHFLKFETGTRNSIKN